MAEVNDVDMSASQTENVKRLRETTNIHSDDAADDESPPKRPCDDRAKAAPRSERPAAADRPQSAGAASVAAAGASPGASTMCCALGPYGVPYVPKRATHGRPSRRRTARFRASSTYPTRNPSRS